MNRSRKLVAMAIAVLLHAPLFWQVSEGLQHGQASEGNATQSGVTLKLAARPAPAPAAPTGPPKSLPVAPSKPKPVAEVKPAPEPRPEPTPKPAPAVTRESTDRAEEEDDASEVSSVTGGQVMGLAGASNHGTNDSEIERYLGIIQSRIQRLKEYPAQARLRGQEGTVEVSFAVGANGEIKDFRIIQSSGSALLDRAVERLFLRLRLPPPDTDLLPQLSALNLPVLFELSSL